MGWWPAICALCVIVGMSLQGLWERRHWLLVYWHQNAARLYWRRKSGSRSGRPRIPGHVRALIVRMALENPTWGAPRIHGELAKLGYHIAQSTVSKYMPRRPGKMAPRWKTFLDENADDIAAIDMLTVFTATFERLYVLVILGHRRRRILHVEVTDHPTAPWLARQITEAFPWDEAPAIIVRDNDGAYGLTFRRRLRAMGIRDKPTMPRSPWQNGYVERVIGSIKRECLNHYIFADAAHLRRVLKVYVEYYNNDRTHLGLAKDTPAGRPIEAIGKIVSEPILPGLHHRYRRVPVK